MAHNIDVFGRQADEVRSIFGDLPIIEAPADVLLLVTAAEHDRGRRGDPNKCMFSRACKRAYGSKAVLFYPNVAYIDMVDPTLEPGEPSRRVVMRFQLPARTKRQLEAFDQGTDEGFEMTFLLKGVSPAATRAAKIQAERVRKERAKLAAKAEADGVELEPAELKRRAVLAARARKGHETRRAHALLGIRSGHGRIKTTGGAE
jgi:hypothetical protein